MVCIDIKRRRYRTRKPFVIARGEKSVAEQIEVTITDGPRSGRGACVPYRHYGETLGSVESQIAELRSEGLKSLTPEALLTHLPAGAARNAVDAALWDLEVQKTGKSAHELLGVTAPAPMATAVTISAGSPETMSLEAARLKAFPILKVKLAGDGDDGARLDGVHAAHPHAQLIADANEALNRHALERLCDYESWPAVAIVEQPVPAGGDKALAGFPFRERLCADESFHNDAWRLSDIQSVYGWVNVKLDKTGGLTAALALIREIRQRTNLNIMIGCMLGSSQAMAPAFLLSPLADVIDLDGPLLLAEDDPGGFQYDNALMAPAALWGVPR